MCSLILHLKTGKSSFSRTLSVHFYLWFPFAPATVVRKKKLGLKVKTFAAKTISKRLTHYDRERVVERESDKDRERECAAALLRARDHSRSNHLLIVVVHFAAIKYIQTYIQLCLCKCIATYIQTYICTSFLLLCIMPPVICELFAAHFLFRLFSIMLSRMVVAAAQWNALLST